MCGRDDVQHLLDDATHFEHVAHGGLPCGDLNHDHAPATRRRVEIIHEVLSTGNGCRHRFTLTPECERVAAALAEDDEDTRCECGHDRYEHPMPCSASECGCMEFRPDVEFRP
jgi:hypothetical protein